jgi:hypothetical protein
MLDILLDPKVLVTFLITAIIAGVIIWLLLFTARRRQEQLLAGQRTHQEATISRLFDSLAADKAKLAQDYEATIADREARIAALEKEIARLRDRGAGGGLLNLFGRGQREAVSALLLENEQMHEQLAQQQAEMRDLVGDLTDKLMDRLERQYQESSRAVRYKQALLSNFLQQDEARQLLDKMLADGRLGPDKQLNP